MVQKLPPLDFHDDDQEWRRLFGELVGTFLLVLVAAGAAMVMMQYPGTVSPQAAVVAPGLMVMAIIMFIGSVSGSHLNPAVSLGFALRGDFPWRRVPGYVIVQLLGAIAAAALLEALTDQSALTGTTKPGESTSAVAAFGVEAVLTFGLVSVVLGTASRARCIGIMGALGIGGYIALAGLWAAPLSGASMNPARTFGPDLIGGGFPDFWVYIAGPLVGTFLAVGAAFLLRGAGGDSAGSGAAQGITKPSVENPDP